MGSTFATLHLLGAERSALAAYLTSEDLLREQNEPWLSVVPAHDPAHGEIGRMEKLAKKLTVGDDAAAALLFVWADDDMFRCSLYRDGRKAAGCESGGSWAKLGRQLDSLFGDAAASGALRYASRCSDLEEQTALLEETVGAALYDMPECEPRRVARGDTTFRKIKAREAALRKRPARYVLTELAREDWPEDLKDRQALMERLRPQWRKYHLNRLLNELEPEKYTVQGCRRILSHSYQEGPEHRDHLLLFDGRTGELTDRELFRAAYKKTLWVTPEREPVVLLLHILWELFGDAGWSRLAGEGMAVCLGEDDGERWRFEPALGHAVLDHAHTSDEGVITLYSRSGSYCGERYGARLWQIDGTSGELLRERRLPDTEDMWNLVYVSAMDAFVYASCETKELVLLDGALEERARWSGYEGSVYFSRRNLCGCLLWDQSGMDRRSVCLWDLRDGSVRRIDLEVRAYVESVLPDGRILGVNESQRTLTVFDGNGIVAARRTLPGRLCAVRAEPDRVCLTELREPKNPHGPVYDALFDETEVHVWRLDEAPQKI